MFLSLRFNAMGGVTGIGLKFEFSTYGDDAGKLTSIDAIGTNEQNRLLWYVHSSSRGFAQQTALALVNSSPGLATLWKASQQSAPQGHTTTPSRPSAQGPPIRYFVSERTA